MLGGLNFRTLNVAIRAALQAAGSLILTTLTVSGSSTLGSTNASSLTVSGSTVLQGALDITGAGAGQISFPATQNPSAGANVLDDYEEGTWTPTLGYSGSTPSPLPTYSLQGGTYTKIGRYVWATFGMTLSNKGTGGLAAVQINGFPFTMPTPIGGPGGGPITQWSNLATSYSSIAITPTGGASGSAELRACPAGGATATVTPQVGDINNTSSFFGHFGYITN